MCTFFIIGNKIYFYVGLKIMKYIIIQRIILSTDMVLYTNNTNGQFYQFSCWFLRNSVKLMITNNFQIKKTFILNIFCFCSRVKLSSLTIDSTLQKGITQSTCSTSKVGEYERKSFFNFFHQQICISVLNIFFDLPG